MKRILHRNDHFGDPGFDQRLSTGCCFSMMRTGLQRDVCARAFGGSTRILQRAYLCMGFTGFSVPTFPDDAAIANNDAPDSRIGMCCEDSTTRQS